MTLRDLTGQESGIIIYESGAVFVVNWMDYGDDMFPVIGFFGRMMAMPGSAIEPDRIVVETVEDIRAALPGTVWLDEDGELDTDMDVEYDDNGDLPMLWGYTEDGAQEPTTCAGTVYRFYDGRVVIAPRSWN